MTTIDGFGRRHFLRGAGGFALAVPWLSSLAPRSAAAAGPPQRRLVAMATDHGGMDPRRMLPAAGAEATTRSLHAATARIPEHQVTIDALRPALADGRTHLSAILNAPAERLTPARVAKMNVLTGFDIPVYMGHNRGAFLGNYAANDQGVDLHPFPLPTLDQLVASTPAFEVVSPVERSLHFGINYGVGSDARFAASLARAGESLVPIPATSDVERLWQRLFGANPATPGSGRPLVVDRVLEHYRGLVSGAFGDARRLSARDRVRLEHHVDLLAELQRKLSIEASCDEQAAPGAPRSALEALEIAVDLVAVALRCGASHVAVITSEGEPISEDVNYTHWHNEVAHDGAGPYPDRNPELTAIGERAQARFFEAVFVRLVEALDVVEDDGGTYLDRSLVYWTMESGEETHTNFAMPIVTAGSAAGFFETGRFLDYRNRAHPVLATERSPFRYPGELYSRFTANVLRSMGVPPEGYGAEMQRVEPEAVAAGARGYGLARYHPNAFWTGVDLAADVWPWARFRAADDLLPGFARDA